MAEEAALAGSHEARVQSYLAMKSELDVITYDELLADIAVEVPGFGGFFVDEAGALNVWLVDAAQRERAETVLGGRFEEGKVGFGLGEKLPQMVVRNGTYDFLELYEWRNAFRSVSSTIEGFTMLDIDEVKNVVAVGVREASLIPTTVERISQFGFPQNAFEVRVASPAEPRLRVKRTTLAGGLRISFITGIQGRECTLGPVARRNGVLGFLTAAHCSVARYVNTSEKYYQAVPADRHIMTEAVDPAYRTTGCPSGYSKCVDADALFAQWVFAGTWNLGKIYETEFRHPVQGSTKRKSTRFTIVSDDVWPYPGMEVQKVGKETGWTYGYVQQTCVEWVIPPHFSYPSNDVISTCNISATYGDAEGDSGAPVFLCHTSQCVGNNVTLLGVHFGYDAENNVRLFSHTNQIKAHLGGAIQFY